MSYEQSFSELNIQVSSKKSGWPLWRGAVSGGSFVTKSICHYTEFYLSEIMHHHNTVVQCYTEI